MQCEQNVVAMVDKYNDTRFYSWEDSIVAVDTHERCLFLVGAWYQVCPASGAELGPV